MFYYIVGGPVDAYSALALVALAVMLMVILTAFIVNRRSREEINNDFELAKMKVHNEEENQKRNSEISREYNLAQLAMKKEIEFKQIESGLIDLKTVNS
jgi:predicted Holliday junction resolvase-like endonuclease